MPGAGAPQSPVNQIGAAGAESLAGVLGQGSAQRSLTSISAEIERAVYVCIRPRLAPCIEKVETLGLNVRICASHNVACSVAALLLLHALL